MADITFTNKATARKAATDAIVGKGDAGSLKVLLSATIELAAATANDTISFGRISSNARIAGISRVYWDDCDSAGAPTLDMGLGSVDSNITSDPDAFSNGHDLATATPAGAALIGDIVNFGLPAWDFVNGQTTDPKGELEVYGSVVDADTNTTGTITVEVYGYLD